MNRKKKLNSILKKRLKKANAKLAPKKPSGYVSKSERARLEQEAAENSSETSNSTAIDHTDKDWASILKTKK